MQNLSPSDFLSVIYFVIGVFFTICGSYSLFIINSLRSNIDNEKTERLRKEENDKYERAREKEDFRDYKRDVAVAVQELIECKNESMSRIDKMEVRLDDICKDHDRNHK